MGGLVRRFAGGGRIVLLLLATSVDLWGQLPVRSARGGERRGSRYHPSSKGGSSTQTGATRCIGGLSVGIGRKKSTSPSDRTTSSRDRRLRTGVKPRISRSTGRKKFQLRRSEGFRQELTWTLIRNGVAERVVGGLDMVYQVDAITMEGNATPKLDAGPDQTIAFPQQATVSATVSDDGLPKGGRGAAGGSVAVETRRYRGPGEVTFRCGPPATTDGKATTTVTFSEPGVYMLQALADDGSGGILNAGPTGNLLLVERPVDDHRQGTLNLPHASGRSSSDDQKAKA